LHSPSRLAIHIHVDKLYNIPSMNSTLEEITKLIDIEEAARILRVHKETLRRWDNAGKLKAVRVGSRGDRKYRAVDIINALENRKRNI